MNRTHSPLAQPEFKGTLALPYAAPLVVAYGGGRDSTGLLVGLKQRNIRPDAILHACTGSERDGTEEYIRDVMRPWLRWAGFPEITFVQKVVKDFKHWPEYHTLEENCLTNGTLPSLAYGRHACSSKWKIEPQNKWCAAWEPARQAWARGLQVRKMIGFEYSPHELRRAAGCGSYSVRDEDASRYLLEFPLQAWRWDLARICEEIEGAGLPVPIKSSCYFCPAMKPHEVQTLTVEKLKRIVVIERRAETRHLAYAESKGWPNGQGVPLVHGLWRSPVKGMRGATPRPGSMTQYIREQGLLPAAEIDRIREATPTRPLSAGEIENWQAWISAIIA